MPRKNFFCVTKNKQKTMSIPITCVFIKRTIDFIIEGEGVKKTADKFVNKTII